MDTYICINEMCFSIETAIDNIKNWSDMQLTEHENDDGGVSATKYNECWR